MHQTDSVWCRCEMATPSAKRFTVTLDKAIYQRLIAETDRRTPRLPKRYVVELALKRLFEAVDEGQLTLGLDFHGTRH